MILSWKRNDQVLRLPAFADWTAFGPFLGLAFPRLVKEVCQASPAKLWKKSNPGKFAKVLHKSVL